jgi:glycosyltransferase involved in cell wall biosynthesis
MQSPLVSVVMSVRNGGEKILGSIYSILNQKDIDLEFILVNDGSTDETFSILSNVAIRDSRIRLLNRPPRGLTVSLIEACSEAKGEFIARQDALDYSMPERLIMQAAKLQNEPTASLCSTTVKFITEERVTVLIQSPTKEEMEKGLSGIIHGSTMFRRMHYQRVGGYRKEFYYAQDVDLWSRLVEVGKHIVLPEVLYENCVYPSSISGSHRSEQKKLHSLIVGATGARKSGGNEDIWLKKASKFSEACRIISNKKMNVSQGAYFIGSCLMKQDPLLAQKYLQLAVQSNPLNLRARLKILGLI